MSGKTFDQLVQDIFVREGDVYAEPPTIDQPTGRGGITLPTYQRYCNAVEPGRIVTVVDLKALTHEQARVIVQWVLEGLATEMGLEHVPFDPLRVQLLDFGYNSGGSRALRWLQRVISCPVSGHMDPVTITTLAQCNGRLVHQALIAARLQMIQGMKYEEGLENRILSFSLIL